MQKSNAYSCGELTFSGDSKKKLDWQLPATKKSEAKAKNKSKVQLFSMSRDKRKICCQQISFGEKTELAIKIESVSRN